MKQLAGGAALETAAQDLLRLRAYPKRERRRRTV